MSESDDRPLPLRVRLPFTSEEEFIRRFGANLSPTGVFIPTRTLKPEGTRLRFELVLTDGARLLRGEVQVARAREESPGVRSGMELAFTELDAASLAFLERALRSLQQPSEPRPPRSTLPLVSAGHLLTGQMQEAGEAGSAAPPTSPRGSTGTVEPPEDRPVVQAGRSAAPSGRPERETTTDERDGPRDGERAALVDSSAAISGPAAERERAAPASDSSDLAALAALSAKAQEPAQEHAQSDLASLEREALAQQTLHAERALELEREALAQQTLHAERASELERAALAQRTARAERVEDLARASMLGADALAARTRKPEFEQVFGLAVDRPELPAARLAAGTLAWCEAPPLSSPQGLRLFARRADSARVLEYASEAGLEIRASPDGLATWREDDVEQEGATWAADWLAAWASESLLPPDPHTPPDVRVVLAVPVHAGHLQRSAWTAAAASAGFTHCHLISAPIAAALAHVHGRGLARRRLLVLDDSGLGFDTTVVQVTGDDVEALSAAGDAFLGGPELDARLAYEVRQRMREAGLHPPEPRSPEGRSLLAQCADVRARLASEETAELMTLALARTAESEPTDFSLTVTRARLDELTVDLIERKIGLVAEVLSAASLTAAGVDEVLFLGSLQRSPLFLQRLAQLLERVLGPEAQGSSRLIAHGAALWGAALLRAQHGRVPFRVSEVLSLPLALAERDGALRRIMDRGTRLPASKTLQLTASDASALGVLVYQGSGATLDEADALGALLARPTLPGDIEVHVDVTAEGLVRVDVHVPGEPPQRLAPAALSPERHAELLALAPEGTHVPPPGRGLIGGLRRLFQKR